MSRSPLLKFLHAAPAGDPVPDAELLRRFAKARDEAAFELLVRRHAEAVWKVCRGVLRQDADAEDAFQATFLALARTAGSVRTECVAGWLHRVAVRAALKLRERLARVSSSGGLEAVPALAASDDQAILHEELARLPDRYRLPVVLCDLEGQTHAEAAKMLGWPIGTVSGRLSRARARLRSRLERRGLGGSGILAVGVPSADSLRAAVAFGVGSADPPQSIVSLSEGLVSTMGSTKLRVFIAAAVVTAGLAGTGTLIALSQERISNYPQPSSPTAPQAAGKPDPAWNKDDDLPSVFPEIKPLYEPKELMEFAGKRTPTILESDPPLRKLQKAKLRMAIQTLRLDLETLLQGAFGANPDMADAVINRMDSSIREAVTVAAELTDNPSDRRAWLTFGVALQKGQEYLIGNRAKAGAARRTNAWTVQRNRLDAEIVLLKHDQAR